MKIFSYLKVHFSLKDSKKKDCSFFFLTISFVLESFIQFNRINYTLLGNDLDTFCKYH